MSATKSSDVVIKTNIQLIGLDKWKKEVDIAASLLGQLQKQLVKINNCKVISRTVSKSAKSNAS